MCDEFAPTSELSNEGNGDQTAADEVGPKGFRSDIQSMMNHIKEEGTTVQSMRKTLDEVLVSLQTQADGQAQSKKDVGAF